MRKSSLFVFAACAAAAWAQPPASFSGIVTNSLTGEPIERVHVSLRANAKQQLYGALTTAEGRFSISSLPPGDYSIHLERTGYLMPAREGFGETDDIQLAPGEKKDASLTLLPSGSISGRVLDATGEPMPGLSVEAEGGWTGTQVAVTDDDGNYRLSGLAPGKYRVGAAPVQMPMPPEKRSDGTQEVQYSATYYPASLTARGAARVSIKPGAETNGIDIHLVRTPIVRVSGTLVGFPNPSETNLVLIHDGRQIGRDNPNKSDGSFELWRLDPGKYSVMAQASQLRSAPVEFEVAGANVDQLVLRAVPAADLSGAVSFEDESAKPQKSGRIILQEIGTEGHQYSADIQTDGGFVVERVLAGRYLVSLSWQTAYAKSLSLGPTAMPGRILDLTAGARGASLGVVAAADAGEISGTVRDDKGPAVAFVVLVPEAEGAAGMQIAMRPNGKGAYLFGALAPGGYKLFALPPGEGTVRSDAVARDLDTYDSVAVYVSVGAHQKVTKDLTLREDQ